MIVATDCCRAVPLLPFLQTLFDIALLRKGPEHIPRSVVMLVMAIALWFLSALTAFALIDRFDESDFFLEIFSALIAVACYSAIVILARRGPRLTQTMSAIIGCGALLMSVFVAAGVRGGVCLAATPHRPRAHDPRGVVNPAVVGIR